MVNKVRAIDYVEATVRIAMGLPPVPTACRGGVDGGIGRCRNLMGSCTHHPDGTPLAPRPDTVLLRATVNQKWFEALRDAGIPMESRSQERREELGHQREERAERLGRNATIANDPHFAGTPEAKHSGAPIFGVEHLGGVVVNGLREELKASGYSLSRASVIARKNTPAQGGGIYYTLQLVLDRQDGQTLSPQTEAALKEFFLVPFGVIVWANEKDPKDGLIKHTVNCGYRNTFPGKLTLHFAGGDWEVKLIPQ